MVTLSIIMNYISLRNTLQVYSIRQGIETGGD